MRPASYAARPVARPALPARPAALVALALALVLAAASAAPAGTTWTRSATPTGVLDPGLTTVGEGLQRVVVTGRQGAASAADAVRRVGGVVGARLDLVDGVAASVPADRLARLARTEGVAAVTADRAGALHSQPAEAPTAKAQPTGALLAGLPGVVAAVPAAVAAELPGPAAPAPAAPVAAPAPPAPPAPVATVPAAAPATTTVSHVLRSTQATTAWARGFRGQGVAVAVIDSGVSPVPDLAGRLVHGPDLSGEGTTIDTFGHGTTMAGAIAGSGAGSAGIYSGVAPEAGLVAVKVAGRNGVVDVSTVLQAMHFVSAYRAQLGIRVLNLSWGVASTQDPRVDPLSYAVQRLWSEGIVVVVAAGNAGPAAGTITKPADDPVVLSVGAYDDRHAADRDELVPAWSSRGPTAAGVAKPDVVAPGRTVVSTRSWGSAVEAGNPSALVGEAYIKGSGTSQAAAVTAGMAAVLLSARPELTPDQVKHLLTTTATPLQQADGSAQGAGRARLARALTADPGPASWQPITATGLGSLEASRGGRHVQTLCDDVPTVIEGEVDARCQPFDAALWTGSTWNGSTWTGSTWNGSTWNGSTWNGSTWNGSTWNGSTWNGSTWNSVQDSGLQTVFYGAQPTWGHRVAGEQSEDAPVHAPNPAACRVVEALTCR